jgi:hypothetical protein
MTSVTRQIKRADPLNDDGRLPSFAERLGEQDRVTTRVRRWLCWRDASADADRPRVLKRLVTVSLVASAAHFFHNAVFLEEYPGPPWIPGRWFVVAAWFLVAATLLRGYSWHRDGQARKALAAISLYCASCIAVFGHYLYGPPRELDLLTNLLIVLEGLSGIALLVYFLRWAGQDAKPTAA